MAVEGARETVRESFEKACARRDPASCRRALAVSSSLCILSAAEKEGKKDIRLTIRAPAREGDDLLSAVLAIARTVSVSFCKVRPAPACPLVRPLQTRQSLQHQPSSMLPTHLRQTDRHPPMPLSFV